MLPGVFTRYGPPAVDELPSTVDVLPPRPLHVGDTRTVPMHPALIVQRRALADLACYGYVTAQNSGRATVEPRCRDCGRTETDCLRIRPGDDDHPFRLHVVPAPRPTVQESW